jgi:N-acetylglucosamine kinase-like BadF-type ATPase
MKYLIGIDVGGTKTECAVADLKGKILVKETSTSSNYLIAGADKTALLLFTLIAKSLKKLNGDFAEIQNVVIGVAGAGRTHDARHLEKSLIKYAHSKKLKFSSVHIVSDAMIAIQGAFAGHPGCILISGTGSIIFGIDRHGKIHRVGGFGRLIGDEGSGYSIGRKAVQEVSKVLDGRGKETLITKLIIDKMKISSANSLINKIYNNDYDIASLAPVLISAAEKNDRLAINILEQEAEELVQHIKAIMKKMKVKKLKVAFSGSLITNNNVYLKILTKKIKTSLPNISITKPELSPVEGAILMAKENLNG